MFWGFVAANQRAGDWQKATSDGAAVQDIPPPGGSVASNLEHNRKFRQWVVCFGRFQVPTWVHIIPARDPKQGGGAKGYCTIGGDDDDDDDDEVDGEDEEEDDDVEEDVEENGSILCGNSQGIGRTRMVPPRLNPGPWHLP